MKSIRNSIPTYAPSKIKPVELVRKIKTSIKMQGICVLERYFSEKFLDKVEEGMYVAQEKIIKTIGVGRLRAAKELGVIRLPMKFHPIFYSFLEDHLFLKIIDSILSNTSIMHLQNGFILPHLPLEKTPQVFQNSYHMDFNRVLNKFMMSLNIFIAITDFTAENGATIVCPNTHQMSYKPDLSYLKSVSTPIEAKRGSVIIFDSTLYHCAGNNISGGDRVGLNHQFTRSYIKQQIDYVRAIGENRIKKLPPRTQQLLGYYTRVPTSLDEFYQPLEKRLYQPNQG